KALEVDGVECIAFADHIPGVNNVGSILSDEPLLAGDEVLAVGQTVAVVYGRTYEACRQALVLIEVEYEELPAILSVDEAIAANSIHGEVHVIERGEVQLELNDSKHNLQGDFSCGAQEHFYLETHAALAIPGEDKTVEVFSSTQHPSGAQKLIAAQLGWRRNQVVVQSPRMGGAFGGKESQGAMFASYAALGAYLTGRPVKCWMDRDTDMRVSGRRHPAQAKWKVGFDDDGLIKAFVVDLYYDAGFAADLSLSILDRGLFHLDNAYWLPNARLSGWAMRTNMVSNTAFRGFGGPQGMALVEGVIEHIADRLGKSPLEVRKANFYNDEGCFAPYGQKIEDFRLHRMVAQLEESSQLEVRRAAIEEFNGKNKWCKRGIALSPVKFGISFTASFLNQAGAYVVLYSDGTVQLNHGGTEMGQGLYTKMVQVCAHTLGIDQSVIRPMSTSTDKVPNTSPTAASSGADLNGAAIKEACNILVERLRPVAAELLGVNADQVELAAGSFDEHEGWACADGRSVSFEKVC
ncbi:MAG: molybdopterin-dependent oxidoreductase, partial [Proteobacteria bacterium]|nr:molybdopterin-dependent oxidoreductase [Pseudomonadota bacterium]